MIAFLRAFIETITEKVIVKAETFLGKVTNFTDVRVVIFLGKVTDFIIEKVIVRAQTFLGKVTDFIEKPLFFFSEMVWVLYALFFVPTRLENRLRTNINDLSENQNPTRLINIMGKLDQLAARRFSSQVVGLCVLATIPFCFLILSNFSPIWWLLTYVMIVSCGIGLAVFEARFGIVYIFIQSLWLVAQPQPMFWVELLFSKSFMSELQLIFWPSLPLGFVIGLIGGVLGGGGVRLKIWSIDVAGGVAVGVAFIATIGMVFGIESFGDWVTLLAFDFELGLALVMVLITAFVMAVIVTDVVAGGEVVGDGGIGDVVMATILGAAGIAGFVVIIMAGGDEMTIVEAIVTGGFTSVAILGAIGVAFVVAGSLVGFDVTAVEFGVVAGVEVERAFVGVAGFVAFVVALVVAFVMATLVSISVVTLATISAWKWVIVFVLGFGVSVYRWKSWRDLLGISALIGLSGVAFWPVWPLMLIWWLLGTVGLLRLPLFVGYGLRNTWAQFRFRTGGMVVLPQPWRWDELIPFPLPYLDQLVVQQEHSTALQVIEVLNITWRQGSMAQRARLRLIAIDLAQADNEAAIAAVEHQLRWLPNVLPDTVTATVGRFQAISRLVQRKINLTDPEAQLQALSQTLAAVDALISGLTFVPQRERELFLPVAQQWQAILRQGATRLPNPYVAGDPLRRISSSLFMGRQDVLHELEIQLQNRSQRPTLLLFGQRRMGKSSLLYQLPHKFDDNTIPVRVDCQAPEMQDGNSAFLFFLATAMYAEAKETRALTLPPVPMSSEMSFSTFRLWLDAVELLLGDRIMLLCFDEYEKIGEAVEAGYFDARILDFLRNLIQHRAQITLLLVGSHRPQEIGRPWSNYLISAVVLPIGYLQLAEARKLIIEPIPGFPLHYSEAAIERIIALTHCQPLLVQLLCQQMVILLNRRGEQAADVAEVEAAIPSALEQGGSLYFTYLAEYDAGDVGRLMLKKLAARGEGATLSEERLVANQPARQKALETLLSRDILERVDGNIRFEVELTRRWWADYG